MKINNTKLVQFLMIFSMSFFITMAFGQRFDPTCDDGQEYAEDVTMSGVTTNATDSVKATKEYLKIATMNITAECAKPENCSRGTKCEMLGLDIEEYPYHKQNGDDNWVFNPGEVTVGFSCICKSTITKVDATSIVDAPINPLIDIGGGISDDLKGKNLQILQSQDIKVYPNPSRNDLKVDFNNFTTYGEYKIHLYNSIGTLMEIEKINISEGKNNIQEIRISDYAPGIYYLIVRDQEKILSSKKFMVSME